MSTAIASNLDTRVTDTSPAETMSNPELRVLHVFAGLGMGGAETWLMSLLKYFHEYAADLPLDVKFDVLLTGGEKAIFDDEALALGARLFYLPFGRRNLVRFTREFRALLAAGNYDVIHDHQAHIAGLHFLLGSGLLPPTRIAHVHNAVLHIANYVTDPLRQFTNKAGKRLLKYFATDILGTSAQLLEEYGFHPAAFRSIRLEAAHCGFDVTLYQRDYVATHAELCKEFGWDEDSKLLLFVGRLEGSERVHMGRPMTHKNPMFALEVAKECIRNDSRTRMVMVGAGEEKRLEFQQTISSWGLSDKITLTGTRSDVPRLMAGSDLLLFPSLAEGLGMVAVEAQAAALRVLASDTTPRECIVLPDLIEFCSLEEPPAHWSERALQLINLPRPDPFSSFDAVRRSPFSIDNSAQSLIQLYAARSEVSRLFTS